MRSPVYIPRSATNGTVGDWLPHYNDIDSHIVHEEEVNSVQTVFRKHLRFGRTGATHFDLSDRISERSRDYVAAGGYGDIHIGMFQNDDGTKSKVALKRLRFSEGDDRLMKASSANI